MTFDNDPTEQARISASDFEQMCDEMRRLQHRNAELEAKAVAEPIDDGGPAFPCQPRDGQGFPCGEMMPGMSLRDWFAGMALQGGLSSTETLKQASAAVALYGPSVSLEELMAVRSYTSADAMLAARKEQA